VCVCLFAVLRLKGQAIRFMLKLALGKRERDRLIRVLMQSRRPVVRSGVGPVPTLTRKQGESRWP